MSPRSRQQELSPRRPDGLLSTGDMARCSGNTLRTVRFYEEAGLLHPVQRTDGGHRLFSEGQLKRLQLVTDLRAAGFSLEEIREVLEAKQRCASGSEAAGELMRRLDGQIKSMRSRLSVLDRLVRDLEEARDLLACRPHCARSEYSPERCSACENMAASGNAEVPGTLRVLWNVEK